MSELEAPPQINSIQNVEKSKGLIRRIATGTSLAVAALMLTSCLPEASDYIIDQSRSADRIDLHMGMAGDSIFTALQEDLYDPSQSLARTIQDADINADIDISTSYKSGARVGALVGDDYSKFKGFPQPSPELVLTDLGANNMADNNNDGNPGIPLDLSESQMRTYLNSLPAGTCIMLMTISETSNPRMHLDRFGPVWNSFIRSEAAARGGFVIDQAQMLKDHPEYTIDPATGADDGVHYRTETGLQALRNLTLEQGVKPCIDKIIASQPTTTTTTPETTTTTTTIPETTTTTTEPTTTTTVPETTTTVPEETTTTVGV